MGRGAWRLRALLALLTGALVVHELRYRLAGVEADHGSHGYLPWVQLAIGGLVLAAVLEFGIRIARLTRGAPSRPAEPPRARVLWPALAAALLLLVSGQEAVELRWFAAHEHHGPDLAHELLAEGGWLVVPLSALVGGACALLLRGAAALVRALHRPPLVPLRNAARARVAAAAGWRPVGDVLARSLAGRGPPLLVTH